MSPRIVSHVIEDLPLEHLIVELLDFESCLHAHSTHGCHRASDGLRGGTLLLSAALLFYLFDHIRLFELDTSLSGFVLVLGYRLVEGDNFLELLVQSCLSDLLLEHWLSLLVEQLNHTFSHHLLYRLLDLPVIESHVYVLSEVLSELAGHPLEQLHPDLLHDPQVGSLSDLGDDLAPVFVVYVGGRLAPLLLELVLSDLLVEDVLEELVQVPLRQLVVQLSPVRFNDVTPTRRRTVGQRVRVRRKMDCVLQQLLVLHCRVLQRYQTLCR